MKKLGKNHDRYLGETIDVRAVLRGIEVAGQTAGWTWETFHTNGDFNWFALHRRSLSTTAAPPSPRVYISTGIHGDEPAGPLAALQLVNENVSPANTEIILLPCLNPTGFANNQRENADGVDLNRDYLHPRAAETRAHIAWLEEQDPFDISICLHEDWESHGFYVYELNPEGRPSLAEPIVRGVEKVCPLDLSEIIEGREAHGGIISPNLDPHTRPQWPEAFWLIQNKTRLSYTMEAPSDFALEVRVNALVAGVHAAMTAYVV